MIPKILFFVAIFIILSCVSDKRPSPVDCARYEAVVDQLVTELPERYHTLDVEVTDKVCTSEGLEFTLSVTGVAIDDAIKKSTKRLMVYTTKAGYHDILLLKDLGLETVEGLFHIES